MAGGALGLEVRTVRVRVRPGGDWFRLRALTQGKRAEEADVVSLIVVGNEEAPIVIALTSPLPPEAGSKSVGLGAAFGPGTGIS